MWLSQTTVRNFSGIRNRARLRNSRIAIEEPAIATKDHQLTTKEKVDQRDNLKKGLVRSLRAARNNRPLTPAEAADLDKDLEILRKNYIEWTKSIERERKVSGVLDAIQNLDDSVNSILGTLRGLEQHQNTIEIIMSSFEDDDPFLRTAEGQFFTNSPKPTITRNKTTDDATRARFNALIRNLKVLQMRFKSCRTKVEKSKKKSNDDPYIDIPFFQDTILLQAAWTILEKYSDINIYNKKQKHRHAEIAIHLYPLIIEDYSPKDYVNIIKTKVKEFWQYPIDLANSVSQIDEAVSSAMSSEDPFDIENINKVRNACKHQKSIFSTRPK